ncbi:MAG: response regulator [Oscillospiraceae bacterium]|jgi:signal transduction histidine kinase/CheY-like chemotaxis protein|nr:response regulator [Oscillospiraceae bacterium]
MREARQDTLRRRFVLFSAVLFFAVLTIGSSVLLVSMRNGVSNSKGVELLQMLEIERLTLEKEVNSEIAVALKLAGSPLIKRYFQNPSITGIATLAMEEIDSYRSAFASQTIFWVSDVNKVFYSSYSTPFVLDPADPDTYWYNMTLYETEVYNFNINYNPDLNVSRLWINAPVFDGAGTPLGIIGTGIELTNYVDMLYNSLDPSMELYLFNDAGEVTGSKEVRDVIEKARITDKLHGIEFNIPTAAAGLGVGGSALFDTPLGKAVVGSIPVLGWYAVAVSPIGFADYDPALIALFLVMIAVIALILTVFNIFTARTLRSLKKTILSLEAASAAKSDFLAKMSHEIRTPMNAILGMTEIALREDNADREREHLYTIKSAGTNLLSIINDILDFSKVEAGKMEINSENYHVSSLINDVISIIRMRTVDSPVLFVVNIDRSIPRVLRGDEIRIRQILLNLLSNALKFTEKGFVSLAMMGESSGETFRLVISVADSGIGIKPEDLPKLFSDFTQFDLSRNKGVVGTGLGLAITDNLAKAMGGDVSVVSEYGRGSTFTVSLPQIISDPTPFASVDRPEDKHVLVYELREMYADSIVCTIDNLDVECALAQSDEELFELMGTGEYNFAFIAHNLYEKVREVCRTFSPDIQIVLLAGFGEATVRPGVSVLAMPVSSLSVSNILNGKANSFIYNEGDTPRFTAPSAKILVVDDIETNLMVARGLLAPYNVQVTSCVSGADALKAVTNTVFDLVLMDHMMPGMDGIETARRIRLDRRYLNIPIVALTANAVSGAREMFLEAGFNDFLSKPVDILKMNTVLEKWIPKSKQRRYDAPLPPESEDRGKLLDVFRRDAAKAAVTLRETVKSGDWKLFTTTAHAMKSALKTIGIDEPLAYELEKAGLASDIAFIRANAERLITKLEGLSQQEVPRREPSAVSTESVKEALRIIRKACEDYDEKAAYAALDGHPELEEIRRVLYLHSDFEEAARLTDTLLTQLEEKR